MRLENVYDREDGQKEQDKRRAKWKEEYLCHGRTYAPNAACYPLPSSCIWASGGVRLCRSPGVDWLRWLRWLPLQIDSGSLLAPGGDTAAARPWLAERTHRHRDLPWPLPPASQPFRPVQAPIRRLHPPRIDTHNLKSRRLRSPAACNMMVSSSSSPSHLFVSVYEGATVWHLLRVSGEYA